MIKGGTPLGSEKGYSDVARPQCYYVVACGCWRSVERAVGPDSQAFRR